MNPFSGMRIDLGAFPNSDTDPLNAAPTSLMLAYSFMAYGAAIDYFWINLSGVTGTDENRSYTFELQADSGGVPSGTVLADYTKTSGYSAAQIKISPSWSGVSLTLGDRYWIVIKNMASAPATDYVTFRKASVAPAVLTAVYNTATAPYILRKWNGTNWTTTVLSQAMTTLTIRFADGQLHGVRYRLVAAYDSNWLANTTRIVGGEFMVPDGMALNVRGVTMPLLNQPQVKYRVYINRCYVAETPYVQKSSVSTAYGAYPLLPCNFVARGGDWVAIMSDTTSASNVQPCGELLTDDADFLGMKMWKTRVVKLESGTWTSSETYVPTISIYLDQDKPFLPIGINRRQFFNQR